MAAMGCTEAGRTQLTAAVAASNGFASRDSETLAPVLRRAGLP
jgi:hypothetical protein